MRIAIIIAMVVFSVPTLPTAAQAPAYTVHGMVTAPSHLSAAELVRVRLERFGGMPIQEIFLRDNRFDIWNVEKGRYTLVVSAPDYEGVQQEVEVPGDSPVIELRPKRNHPIPATAAVSVWDLKVPKSARRQFNSATKELGESGCSDALEHLKKAIRIYEEYGDAHQAMGECYTRMKQMDAAEQEFKRSLELPHLPERHLSVGLFYIKEGNQALFRRQMQLYAEEVGRQR
jgi:tetratricopeptide (TPR) repeat protein